MVTLDSAQWVQLNIGLVRTNGSAIANARRLFDEIEPLVATWQTDGCLDCCFFMRKPPDVRWRFLTNDRALVQSTLSQSMADLLASNIISEFFFSDYEAETLRFGGVAAMNVVHTYFDLDTHNWLRLDRLSRQNRRTIDPDLLLPSLFQDLFTCILNDDISVLKNWQQLAELTPLNQSVEILPSLDIMTLDRLAQTAGITPTECQILASYQHAHQQLSAEFSELWQADLLLADLYEILATIALFNFNRHGFPGERSAPIVAAVLRDLQGDRAFGNI